MLDKMQYISYSFPNKEAAIAEPFHERFNIKTNLSLEKERKEFKEKIMLFLEHADWSFVNHNSVALDLISRLGVKYKPKNENEELKTYLDVVKGFFKKTKFEIFLERLEQLIATLRWYEKKKSDNICEGLVKTVAGIEPLSISLLDHIKKALRYAKTDLGITLNEQEGIFYPSGAKLLDSGLVNENLTWLQPYPKVLEPFDKGLRELLQARNNSEKLKDVVRDTYEALEAFARIVCNNKKEKGFSDNEGEFISILNLNDHYKSMLKSYIVYANKFRHADRDKSPRPPLDYAEVEAFVYLTGLFIRLGIEKLKSTEK